MCWCGVDEVQTEEHALIACPLTQPLRDRFTQLDTTSLQALMAEETHLKELCTFVHEALRELEM